MGRAAIGACCALAALAATAHADDAQHAANLEYAHTATDDACPTHAQLAGEVARQLGYPPFAEPADVSIDVVIASTRRGLRAHIAVVESDGTAGERSLWTSHGDCEELGKSIALAIAIAIDPLAGFGVPAPKTVNMALLARPPPTGELSIDWSVTAPPPAPVATDVARPSVSEASIALFAGAGIIATTGLSPSATQGAVMTASARRGAASLGVELRADRPASTAVDDGSVSAHVMAASLIACAHGGRFGACALGTFGAIRGSGDGLDENRAETAPYLGVGGRLTLEQSLSDRVFARIHVGVSHTLGSTRVEVSGMEVWSTEPLSATIGIAAIARFP